MIANNDPHLPRPSQQLVIAKPLSRENESQPQALPFDALLAAFRRRWKVGLPVGLFLGVLGAVAAWVVFAPKYTASAFLQLHAQQQRLMFETADLNDSDFKLYKNTQLQLMKTPFVLNAALNMPGIAALPEVSEQTDRLSWLEDTLQAGYPKDGEVMQVSVTTGSPNASKQIVQAVVKAFREEVIDRELGQRLARRNDLETAYNKEKDKIAKMRGDLEDLSETLGLSDPDSLTLAQQGKIELYSMMQQQLFKIGFELQEAEADLQLAEQRQSTQKKLAGDFQGNATAQSEEGTSTVPRAKSAELIRAEADVARLRMQLKSMGSAGSAHPRVQSIKDQLTLAEELLATVQAEEERITKLLEQQQQQLMPSAQGMGATLADMLAEEVATASKRVSILSAQQETLQAQVNQLYSEVETLGVSTTAADAKAEEIERMEAALAQMQAELHKTTIELDRENLSRIDVLPGANSAKPTDPKKRILRAAALGLAGLFGPLALLMIWDLSRRSVDNEQAVTRAIAYTNLGTIPYVPSEPLLLEDARQRGRISPKHAELTESVDALSAMLLHRAEEEDRQVFMVSSAVAGEGKSTVACQLAKSLDSMGKRVILVDFDLRRPSVHNYLGLSGAPGVREVLSGQVTWQQAVQSSPAGNLDVIVAGSPTSRLRETINSGSVAELLSQLRAEYDLIIVDSSPILPVVDARLLGKFCDAVILTLVRDVSRIPLATQACEVLRSYGIHVFGTVVIGGKQSVYSKYYGDVEIGNGKLGGGKDRPGKQKLGQAESN